jgi:hypothetical protein
MRGFIIFAFFISIVSCSMMTTNKEVKENIYAKLMVALGEDITNEMQCVAEFMKDPDDIKKIGLTKGSKVILDDEELKYDNTYYPTYDLERKASDFLGKHKWTIDIDTKTKRIYEFEVVPINITSTIPEKVGQTDLKVVCDNIKSTDKVFLMLTADLSEKSETSLDIKPQDGYFIIPKEFFKKVDPIQLDIHFNLSRLSSIKDDEYFGKGVDIEWTKITKKYKTTVIR